MRGTLYLSGCADRHSCTRPSCHRPRENKWCLYVWHYGRVLAKACACQYLLVAIDVLYVLPPLPEPMGRATALWGSSILQGLVELVGACQLLEALEHARSFVVRKETWRRRGAFVYLLFRTSPTIYFPRRLSKVDSPLIFPLHTHENVQTRCDVYRFLRVGNLA